MKVLLITGTDTEVGKTVLTTTLGAYWQTYHTSQPWGLMKLLQTGSGDRELYGQLFDLPQPPELTAPLVFKAPLAPPVAAMREGRSIDLEKAWAAWQRLQQDRQLVLVEALGGLGSPVTAELTVADLAAAWRLPVVLVVPVKLGAIAQAVANVALARQTQLQLQGIVLNCLSPESEQHLDELAPTDLIQSLTHVPILGTLPYLEDPKDLTKLAQIASNLDLERLL